MQQRQSAQELIKHEQIPKVRKVSMTEGWWQVYKLR